VKEYPTEYIDSVFVFFTHIYIQAWVNTFSKYLEIHSPEFDQIFRVFGRSPYDFESLKISGSGEGVLREGVGKKKFHFRFGLYGPLEPVFAASVGHLAKS